MRSTSSVNLNPYACIITAVLIVVSSCKSASTVSYAPPFSMDLSVYRPVVAEPKPQNTPVANNSNVNISTNVNISGSIQPKLNALRQAMAATNKNIKFSQGFRVVVYSGNNREEANKVISEVRKLTTETPELVYEQPNFRVKLGNFFTRADAFALYTQIKSNYPNAVIVNDRITIPIEKYRSN